MIYLAVDVGTTRTRAWLLEGNKILARVQRPVGVRNTSITGKTSLLSKTLRDMIRSLEKMARCRPSFVSAAGMITSPQGLCEVPHVVAPAGKKALCHQVRMRVLSDLCPYPFFFVPGVRIYPVPSRLESIERTDIIRGEESEIVGLLANGKLSKPCLFLHLGSHTKAIEVDRQGRIARSVSTLSGECLDLLRTQTILSDHLAKLTTARLDKRFFRSGVRQLERHGLPRALFMVRLLGENPRYSRSALYSFLLGAIVASDFQAIKSSRLLLRPLEIVISGHPQLQTAWRCFLKDRKFPSVIVGGREREVAFLRGLCTIVFASPVFQRFAKARRLDCFLQGDLVHSGQMGGH